MSLVGQNGANGNVVPTILVNFKILYGYLASFSHNALCDRQTTDRAIRIDRLCYSIGDLKIEFTCITVLSSPGWFANARVVAV